MWIHPVGGVVLGVKSVLQVELGVLQHPLDHVFDVNSFGHVWRRHDVERDLTGVGGLRHALDDEVAPQPLLLDRIVALATPETTAENMTAKRWTGNLKKGGRQLTVISSVESLTLSWMFLSRMFRIFTSLEEENCGFEE